MALAYLLTGDRAAAEDLLCRALATAYRHGLIDDRDVLRHLVRLAGRTAPPAVSTASAASTAFPASTVDDPLWTAVRRLPRARRVALVLHLHAGLCFAEIADLMRRPEGTVRRLTADALAELSAARATPKKSE
jgi:DNA-directed RNA polymerase specialized sigma24 family protein